MLRDCAPPNPDMGNFLHAHDRFDDGFEPRPSLPHQILLTAAAMPKLEYLKVSIGASQMSTQHETTFKTQGYGHFSKWPSVKYLCLEAHSAIFAVLYFLMPKLQGLHLSVGTRSMLFKRAAPRYPKLKRLALVLDKRKDGDRTETDTINAGALLRINSHFKSLEVLILHEHCFATPNDMVKMVSPPCPPIPPARARQANKPRLTV